MHTPMCIYIYTNRYIYVYILYTYGHPPMTDHTPESLQPVSLDRGSDRDLEPRQRLL